jgi:Flp pilus assembly protein TadD
MMRLQLRLLAVAACVPLAGCGGAVKDVLNKLDPPQHQASNDIPEAPPLNTDRSRTLFLIVVQGLRDTGKPRAAIAYLRQYGKLYPDDPKAQLLLADCLLATHEEDAAAAIYKTLADGRQAAASEAGLGRVAASHAAWGEAAGFFQQAAARDAANIAYLNDLGFSQIMTGHFDPALTTLYQANELAPDNVTIRSNLILALHLAGRDAEARALINSIAQPNERVRGAGLLNLDAAKLHVALVKPQTLASADIPPRLQEAR